MKPKRIQRKRTRGWKMPRNTIYVGRPSKWGNPFVVERVGDLWLVRSFDNSFRLTWDTEKKARASAVRLYRKYLTNDGKSAGQVRDEGGIFLAQCAKEELRGKNLACFCGLDCECHADVLLEIANR